MQIYPEAVIATAGGMVSDLVSFNLLLRHCTTVWLQADPEDHMARVAAQGDLRPMAASTEAMEDLKSILAGRAAFYSKADLGSTPAPSRCWKRSRSARRGAASAWFAGLDRGVGQQLAKRDCTTNQKRACAKASWASITPTI